VSVKLLNLTKIYGHDDQLTYGAKNINIDFQTGTLNALIGPSGSGKTTLLNLIAGLLKPTSGEIWINETRLDDLSPPMRTKHRLHHMGFIFQDYQLVPVLTAAENVALPLQLQMKDNAVVKERVEWALERVGLNDKAKSYPGQLSGGQQQRVSIARAIAHHPSLILADEPTANLDSKTAQDIIELFKKLNADSKLTFIFSTHDQRLIEHVPNIYSIRDGMLI
jgi:putative ABC transport system ATP-binding protein